MIYAIRCVNGPVKFGLAKEPKERLGALQIGHHQELYLLASQETSDDARCEALIHEHCRAQRIRGEWFKWAGESLKVAAHIHKGSVESYLACLLKPSLQTKYPMVKLKEFDLIRHFMKKHPGETMATRHG